MHIENKKLSGYQNNLSLIQYILLANKAWGDTNPKDGSSMSIYTTQLNDENIYNIGVMNFTLAQKPHKSIIISSNFNHRNLKQTCTTSKGVKKIKSPTRKPHYRDQSTKEGFDANGERE